MIGLVLVLQSREHRMRGLVLFALSVVVLIATRAERTPTIVILFAALLLVRLMGRRLRAFPIFAAVVVLIAGVVYLGVFRLESQNGHVSGDTQLVHGLLDISPEVREQAFVFTLFPSQTPYLTTSGVLPIAWAVVPGKLLQLVAIDKTGLAQDSSRLFGATMNNLHIYANPEPIRVGLAGELWMDAGPAGLIIGLTLYGLGAACLGTWRADSPLGRVAQSLAYTFAIVGLILPLAVLAPLALVTLVPLLAASRSERMSRRYDPASGRLPRTPPRSTYADRIG
jgi:hypothetical protein